MSPRFSPTAWLLAFALLALSIMSAPARAENGDGSQTWNCYGTRNMESCVSTFRGGRLSPHVIAVPAPGSAEALAAAEARDKRWAERCRPVVRQDRYGMPRYTYDTPGCEYGRLD
jgi:hypothetical protein